MIVVKSADKTNYLTALNRCDVAVGPVPSDGAHAELSEISPFVEYLGKCLERALNVCIKAAKGESIEEEDDFAKQLRIIEKSAKKDIPQDCHSVTLQDKIDVFNKFHGELSKRLIDTINPATVFFNTINILYVMSKDRNSISGNGFFDLRQKEELNMDIPQKEKNILEEAQSIMLSINLKGVKTEYNMKDIKIRLSADVLFDQVFYTFNNVKYKYGTFPNKHQIDEFISEIKESVLEKIQEAQMKN